MELYCISGNAKKLHDYQTLQNLLAPHLFEWKQKVLEITEVQSVDGEEVIANKVEQVKKTTHLPFIIDDVSLLVGDGAYPGALIKHLLQHNNSQTLAKFLPNNTPVTVVCYLGYFDGFATHIFRGEVKGSTCYKYHNDDSPLKLDTLIDIDGVPMGAIGITESHRGKAFAELVKHIQNVKNEREAHNAKVTSRWDSRADSWQAIREDDASYVNHEHGYERFDTEVKRILPLVSGLALDIGCGDGDVTRLIASNENITSIRGIDISSAMIQTAENKTSNKRINYIVGTFMGGDMQYNLIVSRGVVLSHMHRSDVLPTLRNMAASLSENGYLVFDYISNLDNNDDAGRMSKNELSKEWLVAVMAELGLVHVSYNGSVSHRVSILVFHKPTDRSWYFATSNATKVLELQSKCPHHTLHLANIDVSEIKSDDIVAVAKDKARKSYAELKRPVIVTDGGIFIAALHGFPGANSKQAATLLGPGKILDLLENESDRSATRRNCMVFYDGKDFKVCVAEVSLCISPTVRDSGYAAYPLDAILIPLHKENPKQLTYKEMRVEDRVQFTELPVFERFIAAL